MKIVYYSHYFTPEIGAPSARIYDFARQWLAMGHAAAVVTCFPNHPAGKLYPGYRSGLRMTENLDGIEVHRHWTYITPNKGFVKKTLGHVSYLPSAMLLSNPRIAAPDVAIGSSPTFFAAMAAANLASRRGIPFVMEVRDLWPAIFVDLGVVRHRSVIRLLERWELSLYRKASKVVTVTDTFRANLIGRGVPAGKVHTIFNGADTDFWQPSPGGEALRRSLDLAGKWVVLYAGAHGISQALGKLLDSASMLRDEGDIRFLFVGDGAEKDMLTRRAQELRLENVRFLEPAGKAQMRDYYSLADVCLVPLRNIPLFDAFIPSKMFEIMAMGRPIVGALRGEAAEILRRSGGAVVVEPEDSGAIAGAIRSLARDREKAGAMGREARRFVEASHSRRALAAEYALVLEDAIARTRRRQNA